MSMARLQPQYDISVHLTDRMHKENINQRKIQNASDYMGFPL